MIKLHKSNNHDNFIPTLFYIIKVTFLAINVFANFETYDTVLFNFQPQRLNDVSCHRLVADDIALPAEDEDFAENSIFFIETSCRGGLDSRQVCAVESAARANPGWQINVLFAGPVSQLFLKGDDKLFDLQEFDNVRVRRIQIMKYGKDTPLESDLGRLYDLLRVSNFPVHHAADILRMLTLYKYGGVYLDLDMISAKSFNTLPKNWVARELNPHLGSAVLATSKTGIGRNFTDTALRDLALNFKPDLWNHNGPGVITRVLRKLCSSKNLEAMIGENCNGFEVFLDKYFYPIDYFNWKVYFKSSEVEYDQAFTHHLWNVLSHGTKIPKDSLYAKLAQEYCPTVYNMYGENFGSMRLVPDL